jgi:protocatechuate 3,4-dioxygenase, beta subunit
VIVSSPGASTLESKYNVEDACALCAGGKAMAVKSYPRPEPGDQPAVLYPAYQATIRRAPKQPLIQIPHTPSELTGPLFGHQPIGETDNDLTRQHSGEPLGERIIVAGRVMDEDGRPIRNTLIELWQCNAAGRYLHPSDNHPAPIDPNFSGAGRTLTDDDGNYRFVTIKPGAYPWRNHPNAWRPAHIHFSLFGPCFLTRLITQMYFPNDPLMAFDPILQSIPDERARRRLVANFDLQVTEQDWALGYRFDVVLRGCDATPFEGQS